MEILKLRNSFVELVALQATVYDIIKNVIRLEKIPLQVEQLPVILYIYRESFVCQQEIAVAICRDKSSVQRTVGKLINKGYLETCECRDKRKKILKLSENGLEVVLKITRLVASPILVDGI